MTQTRDQTPDLMVQMCGPYPSGHTQYLGGAKCNLYNIIIVVIQTLGANVCV